MDRAAIRALDAELRSLAHDERRGLVHFLRRLEVLDRERAFAPLGCSSAFDYLTRKLHLCEGTAWGRVNAMRLIRAFPQLEPALESGRLNPSQLKVLGPILTPENVDDLIRQATHLSKEKTKELAVSIRPREVPADGLRRLPAPPVLTAVLPAATEVSGRYAPNGPSPEKVLTTPALARPAPADRAGPAVSSWPVLAPPPVAVRTPERSRVEPVAAGRWQWRIGLDAVRKAKLDRLRDMLSHRIPDGDLEKLFEPEPTPGERAPIPLHVRREVLKRDGYRCTFVSDDGERCPNTTRLEMDHLEAARETGRSGQDDLTTRCRPHNQWRALQRYGREYVEKRIAGRVERTSASGS